jgi:serine protease inhibitor
MRQTRPTSIRPRWGSLPVTVLLAGLLLGTLFFLVSCGKAPSNDTTTTSDGVTTSTAGSASHDGGVLAASDLSRVPASAPRENVLSAARALDAFGGDLYAALAKAAGDGNLVFSPASIETALAMTYAGAGGATAEQMAKVLHFELQGDALHQAFNSLDSLLESRSWQGKDSEGKDQGVLVKTANSLWAQKDLTFEKLFLDTLAADYGAGVRLVDYKTAAEDARATINEWVAGQTEDKIKDLIPQGALDELTRLVLVNAVYLDATWAYQFDKAMTADGQFHTLAGAEVTTPMMNQSAGFAYGMGEGWEAVELPYARDELAMLLIVPQQGRFAEIEGQLKNGLLDEVVGGLSRDAEVDLTVPKFEFRTQAGLAATLKALGMERAFDPQAADFSGMTRQERLYISDVIHEAYIAVDEEGTEAAAATAVIMRVAAAPTTMVQMKVDRPFLFALRDRDTGAVLFLGRVTDPTV